MHRGTGREQESFAGFRSWSTQHSSEPCQPAVRDSDLGTQLLIEPSIHHPKQPHVSLLNVLKMASAEGPMTTTNMAGNTRRTSGNTSLMVVDRKSTRLNSSHSSISYAVFCL